MQIGNKSITLLLWFAIIIVLQVSCGVFGKTKHLKILEIRGDLTESYYFIKCKDFVVGDTIIIITRIEGSYENISNQQIIKVGSHYSFELKKLTFFQEVGDSIALPLNKHDIYLNGELAFPMAVRVFSTENLNGLYVK